MTTKNKYNGFDIITENPYTIESETLSIESTRKEKGFPHKWIFKLRKEDKSWDDKFKVKFRIQMTFDPDGSRLKILVDDEIIQDLEFTRLLTGLRDKEWGEINMKLQSLLVKGTHIITLSFDTFLGDDPFILKIKDIKVG